MWLSNWVELLCLPLRSFVSHQPYVEFPHRFYSLLNRLSILLLLYSLGPTHMHKECIWTSLNIMNISLRMCVYVYVLIWLCKVLDSGSSYQSLVGTVVTCVRKECSCLRCCRQVLPYTLKHFLRFNLKSCITLASFNTRV